MDRILLTMADLCQTADTLFLSLLLGVLGIAITIFTVVYSFMETTKQNIKALNEDTGAAHADNPVKTAELSFATLYMKKLKTMNGSLIAIIVADIIILAVLVAHMFFDEEVWLLILSYAAVVLLMVFCLFTLGIYLKQYHRRFKSY